MGKRSPIRKRREPSHPLFKEFLKHLRRRNLSDRSLETYSDVLRFYEEWLTVEPLQVNLNQLQRYQEHITSSDNHRGKPLAPATLCYHTGVIRSFYQWATRERLMLKDPSKGMRYPKLAKKLHRDILTPKELHRLLKTPDHEKALGLRNAVLLRLLALSGIRVTELCNLNETDINIKERELIIRKGKGKKDRLCFIDVHTQRILSRYLTHARHQIAKAGEEALIPDDKGVRMNRYQAEGYVSALVKEAKLPKAITPHSLRRTFCTLMLQAGCNIKAIAQLAGHASLGTTSKYAQVDIRELSKVYRQSHPRA